MEGGNEYYIFDSYAHRWDRYVYMVPLFGMERAYHPAATYTKRIKRREKYQPWENQKMTLSQIKREMLVWTDFYGQDIVEKDLIQKAKTKNDLYEILKDHRRFLQLQADDARGHIEQFMTELGL